jgi:hypothetical protein
LYRRPNQLIMSAEKPNRRRHNGTAVFPSNWGDWEEGDRLWRCSPL